MVAVLSSLAGRRIQPQRRALVPSRPFPDILGVARVCHAAFDAHVLEDGFGQAPVCDKQHITEVFLKNGVVNLLGPQRGRWFG